MKKFGIKNLLALMLLIFILSCFGVSFNIIGKRDNNLKDVASSVKILEIWNVDTFEGGSNSKFTFLQKAIKEFEGKNPNVYLLLKSVSVEELKNSLDIHVRPDILSFGSGISKIVQNHLQNSENLGERKMFTDATTINGTQLANAWCFGAYFIFSEQERLDSFGIEGDLKSNIFNMYSNKKNGKRNKITYSITWGKSDFIEIADLFEIQNTEIVLPKTGNQTTYEAYLSFIGGKTNALLGTQRDLARLLSRKKNGEMPNLVVELASNETDIVQSVGILTNDAEKRMISICFMKHLLSNEIQKKLIDFGLFSPILDNIYQEGEMKNLELKMKDIDVKNIFVQK